MAQCAGHQRDVVGVGGALLRGAQGPGAPAGVGASGLAGRGAGGALQRGRGDAAVGRVLLLAVGQAVGGVAALQRLARHALQLGVTGRQRA